MAVTFIEKLAFGGAGIGRIDGKVCFVPYTAPGDYAEITVTSDNKSFSKGVLERVASPAICRVEPVCPVFGRCGGCCWQHLGYDEQCRQKEQIFRDIFWRSARIDPAEIRPLLPAASPYAYRQRIQLKLHYANGRLAMGFNRPGSHYVIDIADSCPIAVGPINELLADLRQLVASSTEPDRVPQVDVVAAPTGEVGVIVHYIGSNQKGFADYLQAVPLTTALRGLFLQTGRKNSLQFIAGSQQLHYRLPAGNGSSLEMLYSADSFSQVNFAQNCRLVETVIDYCSKLNINSILDLYCGNGNFSLPLASQANEIVGFEAFDGSVRHAIASARLNGIDNARYVCLDAAAGLEQLIAAKEKLDLVIVDPPRSGAADIAQKLYRLGSPHVIYISCDPPTFARDINILKKSGYRVNLLQPVDMFPQTYHLEGIACLQRVD